MPAEDDPSAASAAPGAAPRSSPALVRATGRDRAEWFAALDAWGAAGRPHREIAEWLTGGRGLSAWWAQKLIVEYEQARGLRGRGARPDGSFEAGASRTVAVPVDRLYRAFVDPDTRSSWLPGVDLRQRTIRADRSARFDVDGGPGRLSATFVQLDESRSQVGVREERLPDARAAAAARVFWQERLEALRALLES